KPVPDRNNPKQSFAYNNKPFVAVDTGFEVQIDEAAKGNPQKGTPDGLDSSRTGAIYEIPTTGPGAVRQHYTRGPALHSGGWNQYEIQVTGNHYKVFLNCQQTTDFTNIDAFRGK